MGITVEKVLELPAFKGAEIRAGENKKTNIVKYVDVMEVPDVENWMRADEMLLTTAYAIKNDIRAQETLITNLSRAGAAALCIKPGRFVDKIPDSMVKKAEELEFPLIQLPSHIPYIDIISQTLGEIISDRTAVLETINRTHNILTEVVLSGGGLQAICEKLKELTGASITVYYRDGRIAAFSSIEEKGKHSHINSVLLDELQKISREKDFQARYMSGKGKKYIINPIKIETTLHGFLVMCGESQFDDSINSKIIEQGSIVAALEFLKEYSTKETKKRLMRDLLNDILEGNSDTETLKERARYFKWNLEGGMLVFVLDISESLCKGKVKARYLDIIRITIKNYSPGAFFIDKNDRIVVLIKPPLENDWEEGDNRAYSHVKKIVEKLHREGVSGIEDLKVKTGIGKYYTRLDEVPKSYREALKSLSIGKYIKDYGRIFHYDDIGVYRILMEFPDHEYLRQYSHERLKKLIEYDEKYGSNLQSTLEIYLKNNKRLDKTAEDLFIHRNTVRYRIDRIIDIIGLDMDDGEALFNINFSLKALKAYNALTSSKY